MDNENADEEDIRAISSGDDEQEDRPPARRQKRLVSKLTDTIPKNASSSRSHAGPSTPSTMVSKKPSGSRAVSTGKRKRPATGPGTVSAALQSFQDSFGPSAVAASPSKAAPAKSTAKAIPARTAADSASKAQGSAFRNSFGQDASFSNPTKPQASKPLTTPLRKTALLSFRHPATAQDNDRIASDVREATPRASTSRLNVETPTKESDSRTTDNFKPPSALGERLAAHGVIDGYTAARDKGKGRAIDPEEEEDTTARAPDDSEAPSSVRKRAKRMNEPSARLPFLHIASSSPRRHGVSDVKEENSVRAVSEQKPKFSMRLFEDEGGGNEERDLVEFLSPRKKRKGWVPAGLAERASQTIKRLQTGHNLWVHEMTRLLTATASSSGTKNTSRPERTRSQLLNDTNPDLRVRVLEVLSPLAASMAYKEMLPAEDGEATGGGFITAGQAEKMLVTRCEILEGEEDREPDVPPLLDESGNATSPTKGKEGTILFSLSYHSRSASSSSNPSHSAAYKQLQRAQHPKPPEDGALPDSHSHENSILRYKAKKEPGEEARTLYLPANVADLHLQVKRGEEVWCWTPWSVVPIGSEEGAPQSGGESEMEGGRTALLVGRFGVLN